MVDSALLRVMSLCAKAKFTTQIRHIICLLVLQPGLLRPIHLRKRSQFPLSAISNLEPYRFICIDSATPLTFSMIATRHDKACMLCSHLLRAECRYHRRISCTSCLINLS